VLARRSLWVLYRLDSGLVVGENDKPYRPYIFLILVNELSYRYFNAVKLDNVHYRFVGSSKISPLVNALTRGNG
jgi:hypothetical protein